MYNLLDVNIEHISVITHKVEQAGFLYRCSGRQKNGFVFVTNGNGYYEDAEKSIPLKKHQLMFLEKGSHYTIGCEENGFSYITTAFDTMPEKYLSALQLPPIVDLTELPNITGQIEEILQVWEHRPALYMMRSRSLLAQLLIALYDTCGKKEIPAKNLGRLSPAVDHIHRFYDQEISIKTLSTLCNLSISHFRRTFKQTFGMSPSRYREQLRIYWAKQMLRSDLFTISEIALKLGYYDIYHFSNDFRKNTGYSPRQYAKNAK
jgi:AraC-like DNA-binding protein